MGLRDPVACAQGVEKTRVRYTYTVEETATHLTHCNMLQHNATHRLVRSTYTVEESFFSLQCALLLFSLQYARIMCECVCVCVCVCVCECVYVDVYGRESVRGCGC